MGIGRDSQALDHTQHQQEELNGIKRVAGLDPGVRTFQTCYDPSGLVVEWGKRDVERIYRLCYRYDRLRSRWSEEDAQRRQQNRRTWIKLSEKGVQQRKEKQRQNMDCQRPWRRNRKQGDERQKQKIRNWKRAGHRMLLRIQNIVDDLHKKMANWLCRSYRVILLPSFRTSQMLWNKDGKRPLRRKTARAMATWAHYRFKQRLLNKAREFPWCRVIICDEHHTSKTCGRCGAIHNGLGSNKEFKCPQPDCDFVLDRDINGARNILIRYLTLHCNTSTSLGGGAGAGTLIEL